MVTGVAAVRPLKCQRMRSDNSVLANNQGHTALGLIKEFHADEVAKLLNLSAAKR